MKSWTTVGFAIAAILTASLFVPFLASPATATTTEYETLVASGFQYHLGSASAPSAPTITIGAGEVLALKIENRDSTFHTFTVPHFAINVGLDNGTVANPTVVFVNITTSSGDTGGWEFWCRPHSTGTDPENHTGMIGHITVLASGAATTIVAANSAFHLGSATGTAPASITVNAGDTVRLRIENQDSTFHTFTAPHFGIDQGIDNGTGANPTVIYVTITPTSSDAGTWQFWCRVHSSGTDPNAHTGMVGTIVVQVSTTPPPKSPGFETLAVIGALGVAFVLVAVWRRRR